MIFKRFDEHPRVRVCVSVCIHACAVTQWTVVAPWILVTIRASNRQVYNWNFFFFLMNNQRGTSGTQLCHGTKSIWYFTIFLRKKKSKLGRAILFGFCNVSAVNSTAEVPWFIQCWPTRLMKWIEVWYCIGCFYPTKKSSSTDNQF